MHSTSLSITLIFYRTESVGAQILGYLQTLKIDIEERRRAEASLPPPDGMKFVTVLRFSVCSSALSFFVKMTTNDLTKV